ncbi:MAG: tRNA epoxyqueuosine(34) reductase QueG [Thiotrichaceae bacterium]|nr:tRNA epoxyqueuosine(34) reductase QueG [Thiotrichaceae bacterium]
MTIPISSQLNITELSSKINRWANELGFDDVGFSDIDLSLAEEKLIRWLDKGFQGDMEWMGRHGTKRSRPAELVENTLGIISVRMNYLPPDQVDPIMVLNHPELAYISRYALGRDYHKTLRKRLQKLAQKITAEVESFSYRAFVDSAPVLEKAIAEKAGLGWIGKHSNILNKDSGSWFFLGEIYTNIAFQSPVAQKNHCGSCTACIDICPTAAIVEPYVVDARRCISYLTIEHKGVIPEEFREAMGNRIYGCDDCQLICPWNRFSQTSDLADFAVRQNLDTATLLDLFSWTEQQFLNRLEGSAIRRIGWDRWQRNIAIALGNSPYRPIIIKTLKSQLKQHSGWVVEHIQWAISRQKSQSNHSI